MPMVGALNRRHVSNRVRLLLVPQWPQQAIKSMSVSLCNGRHATLSVSPISFIVAPADNQIGDMRPYSMSWINF
jgi:hypothetical protein